MNDGLDGVWAFSPDTPLVIQHAVGATTPTAQTLAVSIRDYPALNLLIDVDDLNDDLYYVKNFIGLVTGDQALTDIATLSGVISSATGDGYLLTSLNLDVDVIINWQNFEDIPEGDYQIPIFFQVFKKDQNGNVSIFDTITYTIELTAYSVDPFFITPFQTSLLYVKNLETQESKNLSITATGAFTIRVKSYITLFGGNLVEQGLVNNGLEREYTGIGTQSISVTGHSDLQSMLQGSYLSVLSFSNSTFNKTAEITIELFESSIALITPTSLEFSAVKGFSEAEPQDLEISSIAIINIIAPTWLVLSSNQGLYNLSTSVQPVPASDLNEGVYEDNIIVRTNDVDYLVPVKHTVSDTVELGMKPDEINFTDDYSTITRLFNAGDYRVELELAVAYFAYGSTTELASALTYKLPLFNSRSKFFIGRSLNNIMAELEDLSSIALPTLANVFRGDPNIFLRAYYKPCKINLQVKFVHLNDVAQDATITYSDIRFLKGRKPIKSFPNSALLNYYAEPLRVTVNSIALFNFYKNENHSLRIYRNSVLIDQVPCTVGDHQVWAYRHKFKDYTPGDIIEIRLYKALGIRIPSGFYDDEANYVSQKYIVFPEGKQSYHIGWETEHGVLDLMEFTGDISFKMNYESNIVNSYREFKETLRKIDSRKSQNVIINTGHVLQQTPKRLDGLLGAKRAWIMSESNEAVALIPETKNLSNYDSDQELYSYDIEFSINLNNDDKINS